MRIGLLPGSPHRGGVHQYSLAMIAALDPQEAAEEGDELLLLHNPSSGLDLDALAAAGWRLAPEAPAPKRWAGLRQRLLRGPLRPPQGPPLDPDRIRRKSRLRAWHRRLGIELMLYPSPVTDSFEAGTPYVLAVHDLQHRLQPEFPEVSQSGEAEWREYLFRNGIRNATLVLADSEVGKEDVLTLYGNFGITEDRVKVLPHVAPPYVAERSAPDEAEIDAARRHYGLPERYLYYPAQFWPHKNHACLVRALAQLDDVRLVFSGTDAGAIRQQTHAEVLRLADELHVRDRIHDLGYVPSEDVAPLYAGAVALVMPTFFGPTNLPQLEAWTLEVPVITSDLRGIREQVRDAGLLADPRSPDSFADAMRRVWTDEALRRQLAERGRARLAEYGPREFRGRLREYVQEAKERVSAMTWKVSSVTGPRA